MGTVDGYETRAGPLLPNVGSLNPPCLCAADLSLRRRAMHHGGTRTATRYRRRMPRYGGRRRPFREDTGPFHRR
jgi:hypothetical protein